ncbi:hypothetical protein SGGBAA2069_c05270 [Streptococcus gallolyticus subsp. gallolyticus ATCC BAA-2069]|nr:hypothetical protein SGGBAA2069_c05270 [Streptococcus gallolyticus subsp. gallolyticus ATCC BAA-2069]
MNDLSVEKKWESNHERQVVFHKNHNDWQEK